MLLTLLALAACPVPKNWGVGLTDAAVRRIGYSIRIRDGQTEWDLRPVDDAALRWNIERVIRGPSGPVLIVDGYQVPCDQLSRVIALADTAAKCTPTDCIVTFHGPPMAVMPPAPPPPPIMPRRPAPRGSPQSWVTSDDYPAAAVREHLSGVTAFRLEIDASGRPSQCIVTTSSGSALLDQTACNVLMRRARFDPATNDAGVAVPGSWPSRSRWQLPDEAAPLASWVSVTRFRANAKGFVSECRQEVLGPAPDAGQGCDRWGAASSALRGGKGKAVRVEIREMHLVDGLQLETTEPTAVRSVFRRETRYHVDPAGEVGECRVVSRTGSDLLNMARYDCHPGLRYPAAEGGEGRSVTMTLSVTTRPDE